MYWVYIANISQSPNTKLPHWSHATLRAWFPKDTLEGHCFHDKPPRRVCISCLCLFLDVLCHLRIYQQMCVYIYRDVKIKRGTTLSAQEYIFRGDKDPHFRATMIEVTKLWVKSDRSDVFGESNVFLGCLSNLVLLSNIKTDPRRDNYRYT